MPAVVLGDLNRRLASRGDLVFAELNDREPPSSDLTLASGAAGATCKSRYREFIDFILLNAPAAERAVPNAFREYAYGMPEERHPSDRCPVSTILR